VLPFTLDVAHLVDFESASTPDSCSHVQQCPLYVSAAVHTVEILLCEEASAHCLMLGVYICKLYPQVLALRDGSVRLHGLPKQPTWTALNATANVGDTASPSTVLSTGKPAIASSLPLAASTPLMWMRPQ
jgi:hypothetical protein